MNKNIPKMYKNKIDKKLNNSQLVYSTLNNNSNNINISPKSKEDKILDKFTLNQKIYNIFHSKNYIYKADVTIVTKNNTYKKRIIARSGNNLITLDNEYINIDDIIDIYE